jgi:hypothetical protein
MTYLYDRMIIFLDILEHFPLGNFACHIGLSEGMIDLQWTWLPFFLPRYCLAFYLTFFCRLYGFLITVLWSVEGLLFESNNQILPDNPDHLQSFVSFLFYINCKQQQVETSKQSIFTDYNIITCRTHMQPDRQGRYWRTIPSTYSSITI